MKALVSVVTCLFLVLVGEWTARASDSDEVDFVRDIEPILQKNCIQCHGPDEQNGGLNFADKGSLTREADSGNVAIVVEQPENSELLRRVLSSDEDDRMPPDGERLSPEQVQRLQDWIVTGAAWPATESALASKAESSKHWSFKPIEPYIPPQVNNLQWASHPIDRFIQARREQVGLEVAPKADPVALIRRVTYGLTGLPPTPQEVDHFASIVEESGDLNMAMTTLVDRLLSRPSYGERWGRHWMDWVRYADTAGDNSDYPIPQAYLFRNYVVESFNHDIPYDQFLSEQLAGDLLPADNQAEKNRQTIATGYLAMARRFGSLVERYPWHLTIEDTIDNLGRTVLGLTISCARCHDHKFDPISTRDYYGLYGIFASTRYPIPGLELFTAQRDFVPLVSSTEAAEILAPYQSKTDKLTKELERRLAECEEMKFRHASQLKHASIDEQRKLQDTLDAMLMKARKAGESLAEHLKSLPDLPTSYAVQEGEAQDARIQLKGEPERLGATVPRKFLDVLGGQRLPEHLSPSNSGRLELAKWLTRAENPLTARVIVNRVWQRHFGTGLVPSTSDFGVRGELPTHPELLDWLADEFMQSGWSIKHLHRMILTSQTYRLASSDLEENHRIDPDNRFYWKFNRQRLDAESLRDTLLFIGGSLDLTMPTEPYPIPPQKEWKYTQHHPFKGEYPSNRRSVYLMTKRLTADSYLQTFDGPDPNVCTSRRDESVTALQALYFANDSFLHEQADRFATQLLQQPDDDLHRLHRAFTTILCRKPTAEETDLLLSHLAAVRKRVENDTHREQHAWASLSRSLLRLNEFIYLD